MDLFTSFFEFSPSEGGETRAIDKKIVEIKLDGLLRDHNTLKVQIKEKLEAAGQETEVQVLLALRSEVSRIELLLREAAQKYEEYEKLAREAGY